jgi:hypothetical protein
MRNFLERENERAAANEANKQKTAEAKRKAGEHAKVLEQNITDYSRQKNLPAVLGRDGSAVVIQSGNRRLIIIVTEARSGKWEYNLQPSEGGHDDTMLHGRNEDQMIDAVCEWFAGRSLAI